MDRWNLPPRSWRGLRALKITIVALLSILLGCGGGGSRLPSGGGNGGGGGGGAGRAVGCGQGDPTFKLMVAQPFGPNPPGAEGMVGLAVDRATNTIWAGATGAAARSTDGGQTWTLVSNGLPADKIVVRFGFNRLNEPLAIVQHKGADIYRLTNGVWVKAQTPYAFPVQGYSAVVLDRNGNIDLAAAAGGFPLHGDFVQSTDDGASFHVVAANIASIYGGEDLPA